MNAPPLYSSYTLFSDLLCPYAQRASIVVAELAPLPHFVSTVQTGLWAGPHMRDFIMQDWYTKLNANETVPALLIHKSPLTKGVLPKDIRLPQHGEMLQSRERIAGSLDVCKFLDDAVLQQAADDRSPMSRVLDFVIASSTSLCVTAKKSDNDGAARHAFVARQTLYAGIFEGGAQDDIDAFIEAADGDGQAIDTCYELLGHTTAAGAGDAIKEKLSFQLQRLEEMIANSHKKIAASAAAAAKNEGVGALGFATTASVADAEGQKKSGPFFLGSKFSLADICIAGHFHRFSVVLPHFAGGFQPLSDDKTPLLKALVTAVMMRPSYALTGSSDESFLLAYINYTSDENPVRQKMLKEQAESDEKAKTK